MYLECIEFAFSICDLYIKHICHILICYEGRVNVLFFEHVLHLPFTESKLFCKQGSIQTLLPDPITVTGGLLEAFLTM